MKKTNLKHLLRTIRKNIISFVAVAVIAAVSIAIFLGLQSASAAIVNRSGNYYIDNNLATMEFACANGITAEDVAEVSRWGIVNAAEGGYSSMVVMEGEAENITLQALSLCDTMNDTVVLEGSLPSAPDEVAVEELFVIRKGIKVGDVITLQHDGELKNDTFKVTAIINQPAFSCARIQDSRGQSTPGLGSASFYISLTKDAFDASYYDDCFTKLYIKNNELAALDYYSDEYKAMESELLDKLEELGAERASLRYQEIKEEVDTALSDAQTELDDAAAKIADGEDELANGAIEIADAEKEIADATAEIADAEKELADAIKEINDNEKKLADSLTAIEAQLDTMHVTKDLDHALAQLKLLGSLTAPLTEAIEEYQSGSTALEAARAEYLDGQSELTNAKKELADGQSDLEKAKKELADGQLELEDAKAEYAEAQTEFEDAKAQAADLKEQDWILSGRNDIGDVRAVKLIAQGISNISYSMSVIFLFVAIIVCHAAISRMIDEQRVLIGAQKALGFRPGEVLKHYMLYNILSGLLGIVLGCFLGIVVVENLVLFVFAHEFVCGDIPLVFAWKEALLAAGICMLIFLASTYSACAKLVRQPATTLLRGEIPSKRGGFFFENWKPYKKLNLYSRTMIKNVMNDKARMMTTVMGVVGCISLLLICFSLKMGIENSSITQFDTYFLYQNRLVVNTAEGNTEDFAKVLNSEGISHTTVHDKMEFFRVDGGSWESSRIMAITDYEELKDFVYLKDLDTGKYAEIPKDGMLVSLKCAEVFGIEAGDTVEFMDADGQPLTAKIVGVIEHYLPYHMFVTTADYYETVMSKDVDSCVFLLQGKIDGLLDKVKDIPGFFSLKDNSELAANADAHTGVIAVCFALSAVMAVLVLLNQISMHINRKARELAVMRINGYSLKQTKAYIYKDNIVLTIAGLLLGTAAGSGLAYIIIHSVETGANRYVRTPNLVACLASCAVGAFFALCVNLIALRKINSLNLTNVSSN